MTRDRGVIDSELRLLAAVRRTTAEVGAPPPNIEVINELLDERSEIGSDGAGRGGQVGDGGS